MNDAVHQRLDLAAIRSGAAVCMVFAVPFSLAARWAADSRDDAGLATLLTLGAIAGFVIGSGVAAWVQRVGLPLFHAMFTATGTYVVAQTVFIIVRLLTDRDVRWYAVVFNIGPVLLAGSLGGMLGLVLQRQGVRPGDRGRIRDQVRDQSTEPPGEKP
jgi:hypothetical protein